LSFAPEISVADCFSPSSVSLPEPGFGMVDWIVDRQVTSAPQSPSAHAAVSDAEAVDVDPGEELELPQAVNPAASAAVASAVAA
jgi:hypothetical protein